MFKALNQIFEDIYKNNNTNMVQYIDTEDGINCVVEVMREISMYMEGYILCKDAVRRITKLARTVQRQLIERNMCQVFKDVDRWLPGDINIDTILGILCDAEDWERSNILNEIHSVYEGNFPKFYLNIDSKWVEVSSLFIEVLDIQGRSIEFAKRETKEDEVVIYHLNCGVTNCSVCNGEGSKKEYLTIGEVEKYIKENNEK